MKPNYDLDLEDCKPYAMTLWILIIYHHTRFGYKTFSGSKDIVWTNIKHFNRCCDRDLDHSNQFFSHDISAYGDLPSDNVWLQKNH